MLYLARWTGNIGIRNISQIVPDGFSLSQNYPNPFNPSTKIRFEIPNRFPIGTPKDDKVVLRIFDVLGKEVATLVNEKLNAGTYEVDWDGSNYSSGVYFYRLQAGDFTDTRQMLLIK